MTINIQRLQDSAFTERLTLFRKSAKSIWTDCAELLVQAILHYHEHGYDVSRCQALDVTLDECGMGSQQSAVRRVLRLTTQISGIGSDVWKGKGGKEMPENWDHVVQTLIDGEGPALMLHRKAPEKAKKEQGSRQVSPSVKLPANLPTPVVGALQKLLDSKTPEQVTELVGQMEKAQGKPEFADPETDALFRKLRESLHVLEAIGDETVTRVDKDTGETIEESANDKLKRVLSSALNFSIRMRKDFDELLTAMKDAAKEAANEKAETQREAA